jgi:hypothetical protein
MSKKATSLILPLVPQDNPVPVVPVVPQAAQAAADMLMVLVIDLVADAVVMQVHVVVLAEVVVVAEQLLLLSTALLLLWPVAAVVAEVLATKAQQPETVQVIHQL